MIDGVLRGFNWEILGTKNKGKLDCIGENNALGGNHSM